MFYCEYVNRSRQPIHVIEKAEKTIRDIKIRLETKVIKFLNLIFIATTFSFKFFLFLHLLQNHDPSESVQVKKEVSDSVSETPDSPEARHYERTSPIEIPTERSDDRERKIKFEKDSHRYDDNRRIYHRTDRPVDKYSHSKYDSADRNRSRYDQHERSKSRDRHRSDRSERSNSSEIGRNIKFDRNRYKHEDRDSRDNSGKRYDHRTDRVSRNDRSDRYSPSSQRDCNKPGKNVEKELHRNPFSRLGERPSTSNVTTPSDDERFSESEVVEMMARNKMLYGCDSDDERYSEIKNLTEVRSKLATQMKLAESLKNKEKPSSTVTSNEMPKSGKISSNIPAKKSSCKFELSSLRECTPTPPNHLAKEESNEFSFMKTFNQSSKPAEKVSAAQDISKNAISVDDDIINKIVNSQAVKASNKELPVIKDMNMIKQALETAKSNQRLALKYNPKAKPRVDQGFPETKTQTHHQPEVSQSNNLQLVCYSDPRLPHGRDPRVQTQDLRMQQAFSPPSTPPCISNYPPIIQSTSGYKQNAYPKLNLHNGYPSTISPQHHLQSQSNLIAITPLMSTFNNHSHVQTSPVSSTDMSPQPRYQYQAPPFPEKSRNSSGSIHNKFRPSLNDNVERQKYEQSRARRSSVYYEKQRPRDVPKTYGEYKRSLQSTVSSTSEKLEKAIKGIRPANISTSHHDKVYRSGNYSTPIPSVTTKSTGSTFKIPKKTANDTAKLIHATENYDSKDSEDEQSNARVVKDSDDSEHETSGKTIVSSDNETSDIRDPRIRVQALKRASQSSENKSKDAEKQNNVVTSSTSIVPENVSTPDNMEFLKHLTNPNNLLALINLVGQMSDDSTFTKVKEVLEKANETGANTSNDEHTANLSTSTEQEKIDVPKTFRKKNELDRLNEDIRTMFISDGVLNATGRRVCALYNNNSSHASKESTTAKHAKGKKQAKDDVNIQKQSEYLLQIIFCNAIGCS